MQKKSLVIIFTLLFSLCVASASPILAQESATDSAVTENLKKRLQESLGTEESSPISLARGYVGIVKDIIKSTVIMEDKDGKKDILLSADTVILRAPGNTVIKPENIRIDDYIIAMGYPDENEILSGRRVIVSVDPIAPPPKTSGLGTIVKMTKTALTLNVDGIETTLALTSKTIVKSAGGTIALADLEIGDTLIYTALLDEDDESLTATILMRIASSVVAE